MGALQLYISSVHMHQRIAVASSASKVCAPAKRAEINRKIMAFRFCCGFHARTIFPHPDVSGYQFTSLIIVRDPLDKDLYKNFRERQKNFRTFRVFIYLLVTHPPLGMLLFYYWQSYVLATFQISTPYVDQKYILLQYHKSTSLCTCLRIQIVNGKSIIYTLICFVARNIPHNMFPRSFQLSAELKIYDFPPSS